MARPTKCKQLHRPAEPIIYMPAGWTKHNTAPFEMAIEDFEVLRLVDGHGYRLDEAAAQIQCSRSTAGRMLTRARRIAARALEARAPLCIDSGDDSHFRCPAADGGATGQRAVAVESPAPGAAIARMFGRAPAFALFQNDGQAPRFVENPGFHAKRHAARVAVGFLRDAGVQLVIAGRFGPEALEALQAAGMQSQLTGERSLAGIPA